MQRNPGRIVGCTMPTQQSNIPGTSFPPCQVYKKASIGIVPRRAASALLSLLERVDLLARSRSAPWILSWCIACSIPDRCCLVTLFDCLAERRGPSLAPAWGITHDRSGCARRLCLWHEPPQYPQWRTRCSNKRGDIFLLGHEKGPELRRKVWSLQIFRQRAGTGHQEVGKGRVQGRPLARPCMEP